MEGGEASPELIFEKRFVGFVLKSQGVSWWRARRPGSEPHPGVGRFVPAPEASARPGLPQSVPPGAGACRTVMGHRKVPLTCFLTFEKSGVHSAPDEFMKLTWGVSKGVSLKGFEKHVRSCKS